MKILPPTYYSFYPFSNLSMLLNKPKFLYHLGFYDHPLSGVCEYQGEKLYLELILDYRIFLDPEDDYKFPENYPPPKDLQYLPDLVTLDPDNDITIGRYHFSKDEDDNSIEVYSDLVYATYRLPKYIMNHIEKEHKVFQEMVGYHTDRGDIYKPFGSTPNQFNEYYKTRRPSPPYTKEEFDQAKEKVAEFTAGDFIDFGRRL